MRPIKKDNPGKNKSHLNFKAIFWGSMLAIALAVVICMILGVIYYLTNVSQSTMNWLIYIVLGISLFIGSGYAAHRAGVRGLYHGLGVGIVFFFLTWLASIFFLNGDFSSISFSSKLLVSLLASAIGGVLGVALTD